MSEKKSWIEIILMPLVIALVGVIGTYFITSQQVRNSQIQKNAQLESARELAEEDRQIKIIEIVAEKITSSNKSERIIGLKLLKIIDSNLAEKIANAIIETEPESSDVKKVAQEAVKDAITRGYFFAVIGSYSKYQDAIKFAKKVDKSNHKYKAKIYLAENNVYAVSLGGYLTQKEALQRVQYAKNIGIAKDSYIWNSRWWGKNLYK